MPKQELGEGSLRIESQKPFTRLLVFQIHVGPLPQGERAPQRAPGKRPAPAGAAAAHSSGPPQKYGSTVPLSLMVIGLPKRSLDFPAATRIQPSLMQYSSTLVFSAPLKMMRTSRASTSSS